MKFQEQRRATQDTCLEYSNFETLFIWWSQILWYRSICGGKKVFSPSYWFESWIKNALAWVLHFPS